MAKFTPPKQLSVVVPVRNEQDNVAPLIAEIDAALKGFTHEIVYVNDGSTDNVWVHVGCGSSVLDVTLLLSSS